MHFLEHLPFVGFGGKTKVETSSVRGQVDGDSLDPVDVLDTRDEAGGHDAALILRRQPRNLTTSSGVVSDMSLP
jgi:hypothetical protein